MLYGVIDKALVGVIRRWAFRNGDSIRAISRRTGLSRNTCAVEPKFKVPERPRKLAPFADKLSLWLKAKAGKSRKQRRAVEQLHAGLAALKYEGPYNRVAAFARGLEV